MFKYFPHTNADLEEMKQVLQIEKLEDLFTDVPRNVLFDKEYEIPSQMSEMEIRKYFEELAKMNQEMTIFGGHGFYDHYEPSVISQLVSRQEFLTAYTPYQPEVAQGTLTYIFEYQSMIQSLTGMDTSNASLYDGSTATAEAMFMAEAITKRKKVLLPKNINPFVREVVKTYAHYKGIEIVMVELKDGLIDRNDFQKKCDESVAAIIVQKPNFFGLIEDFADLADQIHSVKGLMIENADISTLGVLKTPKEDGADIAVGDCQSLGIPVAFGGPTLGYMAVLKPYVRKMPGRICGMSKDSEGRRAFVLTLQAREQHIRREKANSNICSNQSLMALYATIYLSLMGPTGLKEVNELSYQGAHYLHDRLVKTGKFKPAFKAPFLKEFVLETMIPHVLIEEALKQANILGAFSLKEEGLEYENYVSFAVTEKRSRKEIDKLVEVLEGLSW